MRTTLNLDEALLAEASDYAGMKEKTALLHEGLRALIQRHPRHQPQMCFLGEWYGKDRGEKVKYAEAFEICEYGRRPNKAELKKLFPFFD